MYVLKECSPTMAKVKDFTSETEYTGNDGEKPYKSLVKNLT